MSKAWWWLAVGAVGVAAWAARGDGSPETAPAPSASVSEAVTPTESPTAGRKPGRQTSPAEWWINYDPADFAGQVRKSADRAGISPQLLMAILYNESYKPHDPELERSWARIDSDPAFGIANMHRAAFDETNRGRRFPGKTWEDLPDDPTLAIEAAAWHLHDLAARLPSTRRGTLSRDELLALGYNTGSGNMRLFAGGTKPGRQAQSYLDRLHGNWAKAGTAVRAAR